MFSGGKVKLRDISGPLAQFQAKKFDRNGLAEVAMSINKSLPQAIGDPILKSLLDAMWPSLQQKIEAIPKMESGAKKTRSQSDILEELVAGVRSFDSRLRETEMFAAEVGPRRRRRPRFFMPMILDMLMDLEGDDPIGLLVMAGIFREDAPWLSEVLVESYRELRRGNSQSNARVIDRIHRLTRMTVDGPLGDESLSKDQQMLMMEMPRILDRYLARLNSRRLPSARSNRQKAADEVPKSD